MRAEQKAILVGRRTALLDNPSLTVREWYGQNPLRLVIDRQLTLPPHLHLFDGSTPTLVFTEKEKADTQNLTYVTLDFGQNILPQIMQVLYERKIQTLLVEGGSQTLQSFLEQGLWDEARLLLCHAVRKAVSSSVTAHWSSTAATQNKFRNGS